MKRQGSFKGRFYFPSCLSPAADIVRLVGRARSFRLPLGRGGGVGRGPRTKGPRAAAAAPRPLLALEEASSRALLHRPVPALEVPEDPEGAVLLLSL